MKIKIMMGFLTYLSVASVHECHAGALLSTQKSNSGVNVKDEKQSIPVRQASRPASQQSAPVPQRGLGDDQTMPSSQPAPQQPVLLPRGLGDDQTMPSSQPASQQPAPVPQRSLGDDQTMPSSQPAPQQPAPLFPQGLGNDQSNTIPSSQPTPQQSAPVLPQGLGNDEPPMAPHLTQQPTPLPTADDRALVPYKIMKFKGHEVPYPKSAELEYDDQGTLLRQAVCTIILLTIEQRDTHELVKKMGSNSAVPKSPDALNKYFGTIYDDLTKIGAATSNMGSATEAIQTLQKLVQHVKLADIFPHTKFQRNRVSLASRVMITLKDGTGEVVILDVHGLPESLWIQ